MLHTTGESSIHYKAQIYTSKLLLCFALQSLGWNCPKWIAEKHSMEQVWDSVTGESIYLTFDLTIKGRTFFPVCLSGWMTFKQKLSGFLLAKPFLVGIPDWKQNSTDEINAKSCKVDIWIFCRWECSGTNVFLRPQNEEEYLLQVSWEPLEATFTIKNCFIFFAQQEPLCKQPQTRLFHMQFDELTC